MPDERRTNSSCAARILVWVVSCHDENRILGVFTSAARATQHVERFVALSEGQPTKHPTTERVMLDVPNDPHAHRLAMYYQEVAGDA